MERVGLTARSRTRRADGARTKPVVAVVAGRDCLPSNDNLFIRFWICYIIIIICLIIRGGLQQILRSLGV